MKNFKVVEIKTKRWFPENLIENVGICIGLKFIYFRFVLLSVVAHILRKVRIII